MLTMAISNCLSLPTLRQAQGGLLKILEDFQFGVYLPADMQACKVECYPDSY